MRKKSLIRLLTAACFVGMMVSAMPGDEVITKENGQTIINTTSLTTDVKGYLGNTPLKIYISGNKIEKIEALPNKETPKYFFKVKKQLLNQWDGMTVNKAEKANVDGVTGATMSSDAVKTNVKRGLEYYKKHK